MAGMSRKDPQDASWVEGVIRREPKASGGSDGTASTTQVGCAALEIRFSRLALLDGRMTFD
jgi:hypothetical protein